MFLNFIFSIEVSWFAVLFEDKCWPICVVRSEKVFCVLSDMLNIWALDGMGKLTVTSSFVLQHPVWHEVPAHSIIQYTQRRETLITDLSSLPFCVYDCVKVCVREITTWAHWKALHCAMSIEEKVHSKTKVLPSFTHPHVSVNPVRVVALRNA